MNLIGNLVWLICGGLMSAIGYFFGGIILCCTIVGIPFGVQCFKMGGLILAPFGKKVVTKPAPAGCFTFPANFIWFCFGGLYAFVLHLAWGLVLTLTIAGIPFARQHFKLAEVALQPFNKDVIYT